jgi:hypothetical protein
MKEGRKARKWRSRGREGDVDDILSCCISIYRPEVRMSPIVRVLVCVHEYVLLNAVDVCVCVCVSMCECVCVCVWYYLSSCLEATRVSITKTVKKTTISATLTDLR